MNPNQKKKIAQKFKKQLQKAAEIKNKTEGYKKRILLLKCGMNIIQRKYQLNSRAKDQQKADAILGEILHS